MRTPLPRLLRLRSLPGVVLLAIAPVVFSAPVYQWKDASGRTIYSDHPPPAGVAAEQIKMPAPPSAADVEAAQQRTKAMQEQTEQLREERLQREQRAAEAAKQAAPEQPPAPEEEPGQNSYYDPQDYDPSRPRPPRGDMPVRPVQPIVRPGRPR